VDDRDGGVPAAVTAGQHSASVRALSRITSQAYEPVRTARSLHGREIEGVSPRRGLPRRRLSSHRGWDGTRRRARLVAEHLLLAASFRCSLKSLAYHAQRRGITVEHPTARRDRSSRSARATTVTRSWRSRSTSRSGSHRSRVSRSSPSCSRSRARLLHRRVTHGKPRYAGRPVSSSPAAIVRPWP